MSNIDRSQELMPQSTPAGWYLIGEETQKYWDGTQWVEGTEQHIELVKAQIPVKQSRDKAQYVRNQKGHSLLLHLFIIGPFTLWIPAIYYAVSPNHYFHA